MRFLPPFGLVDVLDGFVALHVPVDKSLHADLAPAHDIRDFARCWLCAIEPRCRRPSQVMEVKTLGARLIAEFQDALKPAPNGDILLASVNCVLLLMSLIIVLGRWEWRAYAPLRDATSRRQFQSWPVVLSAFILS